MGTGKKTGYFANIELSEPETESNIWIIWRASKSLLLKQKYPVLNLFKFRLEFFLDLKFSVHNLYEWWLFSFIQIFNEKLQYIIW